MGQFDRNIPYHSESVTIGFFDVTDDSMNVCEVRLDKLRLEFSNYRHVLVPFLPTVLATTKLLYTHGKNILLLLLLILLLLMYCMERKSQTNDTVIVIASLHGKKIPDIHFSLLFV